MVPSDPLVSLCWYDLPEVRSATDALWTGVRDRLVEAGLGALPLELDRSGAHHAIWHSGRLLFGQACGYDAVVAFPRQLRIVATPCYRTAETDGPRYSSLIVMRGDLEARTIDDLRGTRCVINNETSHSGMNVWQAVAAERHVGGRFFSEILVSGSHVASLAALQDGRADVAAIDCITHALLARERPASLDGTRALSRSEPAPAPPFVTYADAPDALVDLLRAALRGAMADPALADARRRLLLTGCEVLPREVYEEIARLDARARALAYRDFDAACGRPSPRPLSQASGA